MYTITLPDPDGNNTSHLHTYCVAVGAGFLDHTSVIDWYAREVEELMKGKDYYYAHQRKFIHVKFGVVAALADRPEKAFTLKTALLGLYGRIASWAMGTFLGDKKPSRGDNFARMKRVACIVAWWTRMRGD